MVLFVGPDIWYLSQLYSTTLHVGHKLMGSMVCGSWKWMIMIFGSKVCQAFCNISLYPGYKGTAFDPHLSEELRMGDRAECWARVKHMGEHKNGWLISEVASWDNRGFRGLSR
jgi:hypothetical protein